MDVVSTPAQQDIGILESVIRGENEWSWESPERHLPTLYELSGEIFNVQGYTNTPGLFIVVGSHNRPKTTHDHRKLLVGILF